MSNGYAGVGLQNPKFAVNVGAALRAAYCYDVKFVALTGRRAVRSSTDTPKAWRHLPVFRTDDLHSVIPFNCVPVAVDLVDGAQNLIDYKHPKQAFYIFGAEDATLGKSILGWCKDIIYIPTSVCMNLAACVNVVLYDRMAKVQK